MLEIREADFEKEVLQSSEIVVLDFYAPWCGPCRMLAPVLEQLQANNVGKIKVVKINTDNDPDLAVRYQIASLPTIIFMKNGKPENTLLGLQSAAQIQQAIDAIASS